MLSPLFSDKPISETTSTTEAENEIVTDETPTTDETSAEETATEDDISAVVDAMNDTLKPEAKEDLEKGEIKDDMSRVAEVLIKAYKKDGTLGGNEFFFVDSGKKVIDTIKGETVDAESVIKKADFAMETPDTESAVPYTDREKQNWESSNTIIVYESDEQFEAFVEKVLNNEDTHKKIYFGKIPDATAQMVLDKTGVDVSGHNIALKGYEIRKILLNSHGDEEAEATRGQEPITTDDLKNIPSVITNPDDVNLSDKEYEGKPALLFEKTIDGKNYVVAYVSRKHHDIAIQTMYKKRSLATAENADALSSTPETTNSTASNNIVSQDNDIVNSSDISNDNLSNELSNKTSNESSKDNVDNGAKVLQNQSESGTIESKTGETSVEREDNGNESIRESVLSGDGRRRTNESTRKQTERVSSFERRNQGRDATERKEDN